MQLGPTPGAASFGGEGGEVEPGSLVSWGYAKETRSPMAVQFRNAVLARSGAVMIIAHEKHNETIKPEEINATGSITRDSRI